MSKNTIISYHYTNLHYTTGNIKIGSPQDVSWIDLNVREVQKRAIPVLPLKLLPRSSRVPIDKALGDNITPKLGFMTPNNTVMCIENNFSSQIQIKVEV